MTATTQVCRIQSLVSTSEVTKMTPEAVYTIRVGQDSSHCLGVFYDYGDEGETLSFVHDKS